MMKNALWLTFLLSVNAFWGLLAQNGAEFLLQIGPGQEKELQSFFSKNIDQQLFSIEKISKHWNVFLLKSSLEKEAAESQLTKLRAQGFMRYLAPNRPARFREPAPVTPNDDRYNQQWNLGMIEADQAWGYSTGGLSPNGDTLVVAIIDDGCDTYHEDLADNIFHNHAEIPGNQLDDDGNGYVDDFTGWNTLLDNDSQPLSNHGTSVSGIVGAVGDNSTGLAGINWKVKILPITITHVTEAEIVEAYEYVLTMRELYNNSQGQLGAYVVVTNASFGIDGAHPADYPLWCGIYDDLGAAGVLSVAATTNVTVNVDLVGDVPTGCSSPYLITVTAVNDFDVRLNDSGFGVNSIDLGAPGDALISLKPQDVYADFYGTSAAAPHVTGAVSLLYSLASDSLGALLRNDPAGTALLVKGVILNGTAHNASLEGKTVTEGRLDIGKSMALLADTLGGGGELRIQKIYPNPVEDVFNIEFMASTNGPIHLEMYDLCGKKVLESTLGTLSGPSIRQVNMAGMARGVYMLRLRNQERCDSYKICYLGE